MAGETTTGGRGGSGPTPEVCSFDISAEISANIPTVGVVDWSTDLAGLTAAKVEFWLDDPADDELNVGSGGPISVSEQHALLLGLKSGRSYTYRIVATAGDTVCVSPEHSLRTLAEPAPPTVTRTAGEKAPSQDNGFIVACSYDATNAMIIDADGDVVWWFDVPFDCSRAHMDWAGDYVWMMKANPTYDTNGDVRRVRMDGGGAETLSGLEKSHHDLAVLPGGVTAFLVWADESQSSSDLVERAADGTLHTVTHLDSDTYGTLGSGFHANALRYYARDDSFSVSDLSMARVFKLNRDGELTWSAPMTMYGTHGHQLLANGNLLYFEAHNSNPAPINGPSPVYEYSFTGAVGSQSAHLEWTYVNDASSFVLGDIARLPNGNTLVTYSTGKVIQEVTPAGELVQTLSGAGELGYTTFRPTLYGPPQ